MLQTTSGQDERWQRGGTKALKWRRTTHKWLRNAYSQWKWNIAHSLWKDNTKLSATRRKLHLSFVRKKTTINFLDSSWVRVDRISVLTWLHQSWSRCLVRFKSHGIVWGNVFNRVQNFNCIKSFCEENMQRCCWVFDTGNSNTSIKIQFDKLVSIRSREFDWNSLNGKA